MSSRNLLHTSKGGVPMLRCTLRTSKLRSVCVVGKFPFEGPSYESVAPVPLFEGAYDQHKYEAWKRSEYGLNNL